MISDALFNLSKNIGKSAGYCGLAVASVILIPIIPFAAFYYACTDRKNASLYFCGALLGPLLLPLLVAGGVVGLIVTVPFSLFFGGLGIGFRVLETLCCCRRDDGVVDRNERRPLMRLNTESIQSGRRRNDTNNYLSAFIQHTAAQNVDSNAAVSPTRHGGGSSVFRSYDSNSNDSQRGLFSGRSGGQSVRSAIESRRAESHQQSERRHAENIAQLKAAKNQAEINILREQIRGAEAAAAVARAEAAEAQAKAAEAQAKAAKAERQAREAQRAVAESRQGNERKEPSEKLPTYDESVAPPPYGQVVSRQPSPQELQELYNKYFRWEPTPHEELNALWARFSYTSGKAVLPNHMLKGPLTDDQIQIMQAQLQGQDPMVARLFSTAMTDVDSGIAQLVMRIPVLLFGNVYDLHVLDSLPVDDRGWRTEPRSGSRFRKEDVRPYNTLAEAISFLLYDIAEAKQGRGISEAEANKRAGTGLQSRQYSQSQEVQMLETFYKNLSPRHKKIFNIMCRDAKTGDILVDDPVTLPDGNTYNMSTIDDICGPSSHQRISWPCPKNPNIIFSISEIQTCHPIRNVLAVLKHEVSWKVAVEEQQRNFSERVGPLL